MTSSFDSGEMGALSVQVVGHGHIPLPGAAVALRDDQFAPVAEGADGTFRGLRSGMYRVEARVGATRATRLALVAPGEHRRLTLVLGLNSAAPIHGATTTTVADASLAARLSAAIAAGGGHSSGLAILLRHRAGWPTGPLDASDVAVLDVDHRAVTARLDHRSDATAPALGWAGRLPPGGYVLRIRTTGADGSTVAVDQALSLAPGWQTVVFVPAGEQGAEPHGMTIHMAGLATGWDPGSLEVRRDEVITTFLRDRVTAGADLLLEAIRTGSPLVAAQAAHVALRNERDRSEALAALSDRFPSGRQALLPDLAALGRAVGEGGSGDVTWPPMLTPSYVDLLLPGSAFRDDVLPDGSLAAQIAPFVRPSWPWLQWSGLDRGARTVSEPVRKRVQAALVATAQTEELPLDIVLRNVRTVEIATRTRLPRSLVAAALRDDVLPVSVASTQPAAARPLDDEVRVGSERFDQMSSAAVFKGASWPSATRQPRSRKRPGALLVQEGGSVTLLGDETADQMRKDLLIMAVGA